jgi:sterol desaturase/sphingolipid hydroxylase (fatty acid hydroxylase superfamily)
MAMEAILESVFNSLRSIGFLLSLIAVLLIVELALPFFKRRGGLKRNVVNITLNVVYFGINLVLTAATVGLAAYAEASDFGLFANLEAPSWLVVLIALVALDLFSYISHVLMHKVPFLWRVHRVHHSDIHLDATTAFRQHPMEAMVRFMFTMAPALLLGFPAAAVAIYRLLSGVNAILEHVNLSLWQPLDTALSLVYVTPNMHKVHHSRVQAETDSNYSNLFSIYDRIFGTFTPTKRAAHVDYGLDNYAGATLGELLASPFDLEERHAPSPAPMAMAKSTG